MVRWCCELLSDGKCNMRLVRLLSGLALESNRFRGRTTPNSTIDELARKRSRVL